MRGRRDQLATISHAAVFDFADPSRIVRAIADETDNAMVRRSMLRIADEYERVAQKAEERVRTG